MKYLEVSFVCQMQSCGFFYAYNGSMLRGALGGSLRRTVCMTQKKDCTQCMLAATCIFPRLFTAAAAPEKCGTAPMIPPPFCLLPSLEGQRVYEAGENFSFTLKLFSYAVDYLPYFIHAFTLAGRKGLGGGAEHGQGIFRIVDVVQDGRSVYDAEAECLRPCAPRDLSIPAFCPVQQEGSLDVRLLTPLRFKHENHLSADLDFFQLMLLIIRRIRSLLALDGEAFLLPREEFSALARVASDVRLEKNDLVWQDWSRYSGRQNTRMKLGGLIGRIRYRGPVASFEEYLDFARHVHIGKPTSFGLGAFSRAQDKEGRHES